MTFTTVVALANGQSNDLLIRRQVLVKANVDSNFIFGKWSENAGTETHLKYLGKVTTKHGKTFKVVNSKWYWGLSRRATSRILIFAGDNRYVGNYYVTVTSDLPTKMQNGNLIFENIEGGCDSALTTIVDLKNGLPNRFFRKCQNESVEIYSFESN